MRRPKKSKFVHFYKEVNGSFQQMVDGSISFPESNIYRLNLPEILGRKCSYNIFPRNLQFHVSAALTADPVKAMKEMAAGGKIGLRPR